MKKTIICFLICFVPFLLNAQKVKIEGHVEFPDKNGWPTTFISLNDTIAKLHKLGLKDDKIINDKDVLTHTDSTNYFSINAKPSDTLFFRNNLRLYHVEKHAVSDLVKRKNIVIKFRAKPCIQSKKCDQKTPSKKYIFVGSKINVTHADSSNYCYESWDSEYNVKYKIEQEFGDHFPDSTITFTAYDHDFSHRFLFEDYNVNVLLFVEERCGKLVHKRYQFYPVYKTQNGRWATPVDSYNDTSKEDLNENIVFDKSVSFDLPDKLSGEQMAQFIKNKFPEKYYHIKDGKAYPVMGRYAEDLVKDWMETYSNKLK